MRPIARTSAKVTRTRALVLADPDFDLDGNSIEGDPGETRSLTGLMKFARVRRLPGTAVEARAEAVVSTLWQVPDRQSAELMSLFFTNLAADKSKAEALRQA